MYTSDTYEAAFAATLPDTLPWRLEVRPRLKRAHMEVTGGMLVIRLPKAATMPPQRLAEIVAAQGPVLVAKARARGTAERTGAGEHTPTKQLVNGEGFELFGRSYRLRLVDNGPTCEIRRLPVGQIRADGTGSMGSDQYLCLRRDVATPETVIDWYRGELAVWLGEQVPPIAARLGVRPGLTCEVRPHRRGVRFGTWGRYLPGEHRITVPWIVAQIPLDRARHVLHHEVAHAAQPSGTVAHGREWQVLMSRISPDWRDLERLQRRGTGLSLWEGGLTPHVSGWEA